jgi:hypothetical protein
MLCGEMMMEWDEPFGMALISRSGDMEYVVLWVTQTEAILLQVS